MDQKFLKLWLDLLDCQTRLTFPLELPYYYGCPEWKAAPVVLDLGTGPGYYLRGLAELFRDKTFVGIDMEESYLDVARDRAPAHIQFVRSDLFEFQGQYPVCHGTPRRAAFAVT